MSGMVAAVAVIWWGCKAPAPQPSNFLSDYGHLQKVDDSIWRYVDSSRLAPYAKFTISPVTVISKGYWGATFTSAQKQRIADTFRQKLINTLSTRYQVVSQAEANTAEIRVAITQAYRVGNSLALGVEAEILDPQSHQQLAALRGVQIGPPELSVQLGLHNPADPGRYVPPWWDWPSAVALMERWANQVLRTVEEAHKR